MIAFHLARQAVTNGGSFLMTIALDVPSISSDLIIVRNLTHEPKLWKTVHGGRSKCIVWHCRCTIWHCRQRGRGKRGGSKFALAPSTVVSLTACSVPGPLLARYAAAVSIAGPSAPARSDAAIRRGTNRPEQNCVLRAGTVIGDIQARQHIKLCLDFVKI